MSRQKQHNVDALGGFLQGFALALQRALERRDRLEEFEARRGERREDDRRYREQFAERQRERDEEQAQRREEFEDLKRHRKESERMEQERIEVSKEKAGKTASGDSKDYRSRYGSRDERTVARRVRSHLEKGVRDPQRMFEIDSAETRRKMKVGQLPSALRASTFSGRKDDEEVEIGTKEIEDLRTRLLMEGPETVFKGAMGTGSGIEKELQDFKKKLASVAEREGLTPSSYEDVLDEEMAVFERDMQNKMGPKEPPQSDAGPMPVPKGNAVDTRDGKVADHISNLYAQRFSRDPQIAMAAGHEIRKLGYPGVPSPFDAFDPQGLPSPELLRAAQRDPELAALVMADAQTQQALQGPAQTQTGTRPASRPQRVMGRTAEQPRPQSQPQSRPGTMTPKRQPFMPPPPVPARR